MFGLFRPACPCDPAAKNWIEARLDWLCAQFDSNVFTDRPVILPTEWFFPDPYDGSRKSARVLLDRVCSYMDVSPELVELRFVADAGRLWLVNERGDCLPQAAGTYHDGRRRAVVSIAESELSAPMSLVGTMAHELGHQRLMGEGRTSGDEFDNELLTDLAVVHFGLGIFLANVPRNWPADSALWPGTDLRRPGYMSPPMFGYALAHVAWFQDDARPAWAKHLDWHARTNLKQGIRYLWRTGLSTFKPFHLRRKTQS